MLSPYKESKSTDNSMSSEFGLRGPKTPWVCPNDRQLALRAKLRTGWSVKTSQFNTYPKPQPLTESEQQMIVSVIKKAEELDLSEQKRVGKLVDRLEGLKKLASGNGITECILCGDSFGLSVFGRTNYRCCDCKKAVCRKCVVELSTGSSNGPGNKDPVVRLCKICSENRELIKRSGAWFYKGVPKYILPEKKSNYGNHYENNSSVPANCQEKRYMSRYLNSHLANSSSSSTTTTTTTTVGNKRMGILWSRNLTGRSQSEGDNESSSGDETGASSATAAFGAASSSSSEKFHSRRKNSDTRKPSRSSLSQPQGSSSSSFQPPNVLEDHLYEISDLSISGDGNSGSLLLKQKSFERFDLTGSVDQVTLCDNNQKSSGSSSNDGLIMSSACTSQTSPSSSSLLHSSHGIIEIELLFDDTHQALHCSIHKAKDLPPMDINGLADPFCELKLIPSRFQGGHHRTKTVHKTLQPVFNETLTFYGLSQNHLAWQTLQINVMDDDKWGRDCLGSVQIPLHRIRPQQTRSFTLSLVPRSNEDKEWGRGRLLLSLNYLTEKSTLIVGLVRAQDLPALDIRSGSSDPFVKVRLLHDMNLGTLSSGCQTINRKYKTSVKWRNLNPEFREEFSFKVSIVDLPRLALVISVWDKDVGKNNDYIGGIVLSNGSKGERLKHWTDVIKLPNTKHTKWHSLCTTELPAH